jgi:exosortase
MLTKLQNPNALSWAGVAALAWFAILMLCVYFRTLLGVIDSWSGSPEMSHGYLVPIIVCAGLWAHRSAWAGAVRSRAWFGLWLVLLAFVLHFFATAIQNQFFSAFSFLVTIAGMLLYLEGVSKTVSIAGPLALLVFAVQPPVLLYESMTMPLQTFASISGEWILDLLGYSVLRQGNVLILPGFTLSVADACSGLASLYSMLFLSMACIVFLSWRARFVVGMLVIALVSSLFTNTLRIALTAILGTQNHAWTQGDVHDATGLATFVVGSILVLLACAVLYKREVAPHAS